MITDFYSDLSKAFVDIADERRRQDEKWGEQNRPPIDWVSILTEEVGELAHEVNELSFGVKPDATSGAAEIEAKLRAELVQCAAVCVAWLQCIERGKWRKPAK